jgi:hypothetical protein
MATPQPPQPAQPASPKMNTYMMMPLIDTENTDTFNIKNNQFILFRTITDNKIELYIVSTDNGEVSFIEIDSTKILTKDSSPIEVNILKSTSETVDTIKILTDKIEITLSPATSSAP